MRTAFAAIVALVLVAQAGADDHSCPSDRPYARGKTACDSCDHRLLRSRYRRGQLTETRASEVFRHEIQVTVFCDANRPVDVDDVFSQLNEVEHEFKALLGDVTDQRDGWRGGKPRQLEVVVGICDAEETVYEDVDDCAMYLLCRNVGLPGCELVTGISYRDSDIGPVSFVPWLPDGITWWSPTSRYGNLHHEWVHLLDYTYLRRETYKGPDLEWWVDGLPQYIQAVVLRESESWRRANFKARLLDVFTGQYNADPYYDGMRVFAFLREHDHWTLARLANSVKYGIYGSAGRHYYWHDLLGQTAWWWEIPWQEESARQKDRYIDQSGGRTDGRVGGSPASE